MQRNSNSICTLVGALMLSAGFATPMVLADEPEKHTEQGTQIEQVDGQANQDAPERGGSNVQRPSGDLIEVRVSLPDGRTIVRLEPRQSTSARYTGTSSTPVSTSRQLPDGSRISVAARGVSGGSNSASARTSGGGGAAASSGRAGGSGGGSSASSGAQGAAGGTKAADQAGQQSSGGGVFSFGRPGGEDIASRSGGSAQGSRHAGSDAGSRTVPTIGEPTFNRDGDATGGQGVKFHNEGMSATVIGNRVYFTGTGLVNSNQPFSVIVGTRVTADSVVMDESRMNRNSAADALSSSSPRNSEIVLEFASDTVVDLMMFSHAADLNHPDRIERTWTVRVR